MSKTEEKKPKNDEKSSKENHDKNLKITLLFLKRQKRGKMINKF